MTPTFLEPNDLIAIVSPGRSVTPEQLAPTLEKIESNGVRYALGKHVFEKFYNGYSYAGKDWQRAQDLQWAIDHPEVKAIWFAAGGYGAIRVVDELNWQNFYANPKWLIGFSDNTVFHQWLNQRHIPSIYSPTVKPLKDGHSEESYANVFKILTHQPVEYSIPTHPFNNYGTLTGEIVGGNLAMIYSMLGSNDSINCMDKILFLEDWYENWYALDRMLMNLKRNGILEKAKGFLIGSFRYMDTKEENPNYQSEFDPVSEEIIREFLQKYTEKPYAFGIPTGHCYHFLPLILGKKSTIEIEEHGVKILFQL